jgi:hypothetical protein
VKNLFSPLELYSGGNINASKDCDIEDKDKGTLDGGEAVSSYPLKSENPEKDRLKGNDSGSLAVVKEAGEDCWFSREID